MWRIILTLTRRDSCIGVLICGGHSTHVKQVIYSWPVWNTRTCPKTRVNVRIATDPWCHIHFTCVRSLWLHSWVDFCFVSKVNLHRSLTWKWPLWGCFTGLKTWVNVQIQANPWCQTTYVNPSTSLSSLRTTESLLRGTLAPPYMVANHFSESGFPALVPKLTCGRLGYRVPSGNNRKAFRGVWAN